MNNFELSKLDIIWNITSICMWDCGVCCVDATHVKARNNIIEIKSEGLNKLKKIIHSKEKGSIFDQALDSRVSTGLELSLSEKLTVLENLKGLNVKIDFSGGDPLSVTSTIVVMRKASEFFGKDNVTLTATGAGLSRVNVNELITIIGELNFTYDSSGNNSKIIRPNGYAFSNLKKASQFSKAGIKTRAETPLTKDNIDKNTLTRIYLDLHKANISTHLIMRLFPSGRGVFLKDKIPTTEEYKIALELLYELERKYEFPKIKLQCALKFLDSSKNFEKNPCDLVTNSFGLMPNGTLIASPWAINNMGLPISDFFVLGNLSKTKMVDILSTEKVKKFIRKADENFGHCKMQSFFGSDINKEDRMFEKQDPLYSIYK